MLSGLALLFSSGQLNNCGTYRLVDSLNSVLSLTVPCRYRWSSTGSYWRGHSTRSNRNHNRTASGNHPAESGCDACLSQRGIRVQDRPILSGFRVSGAPGVSYCQDERIPDPVGGRRHRLAHSNRRLDVTKRKNSRSRFLFFFKARRRMVCVGMVMGRGLLMVTKSRRNGGRIVGQHSRNLFLFGFGLRYHQT
jgi:hypothetical protein